MTKLETNALRIIEFLYPDIDINGIEKYKDFFSSYNGLMPIVYECNKSNVDYPININPPQITAFPGNDLDIYRYDTEPEFIEALQLAVIKYLEIKNDNSRVQQTIQNRQS